MNKYKATGDEAGMLVRKCAHHMHITQSSPCYNRNVIVMLAPYLRLYPVNNRSLSRDWTNGQLFYRNKVASHIWLATKKHNNSKIGTKSSITHRQNANKNQYWKRHTEGV